MTDSYVTDANARIGGAEIGLNVQSASPPTQAYVGKDDSLWVAGCTQNIGLVVTVNARLLMPNGDIKLNQWTLRFAQSRAAVYQQIQLPECFLLSVAAVCNFQAGGSGSVYILVVLSRLAPGLFNSAQMLCQGYSNSNQPVSWPGGVNTTSVDCVGTSLQKTGTIPAAGAEITETVPANTKWQLLSIRFQFNTSATVGQRVVNLTFDDGLNTWAVSGTINPQNEGHGWLYNFAAGFAGALGTTSPQFLQLPSPVILLPGWRIKTATVGIQANDQYLLPLYCVQEWLLP